MICASIKVKKMSDAIEMLETVPNDYDLVEIWINEIEDLNLITLKEKAKHSLLMKVSDCSNQELLRQVIENGFEYVDIDIEDFDKIKDFHRDKTKLIASYHDFEGTPDFEKGKAMVERMKNAGADIGKIVCVAKDCHDNLIPLKLLKLTDFPLISFCMGEHGRLSRVLAPQCGSLISFIPPDTAWKTADGQIIYDEWKVIKELLFKK
ncbi:type I 3-dehydroquinate dehydratase [Patescibacteria group bacterium]